MPKRRKPQKHKVTRVRVRAERRLEPDWDRFAWALLQHARRLIEQEAQRK